MDRGRRARAVVHDMPYDIPDLQTMHAALPLAVPSHVIWYTAEAEPCFRRRRASAQHYLYPCLCH